MSATKLDDSADFDDEEESEEEDITDDDESSEYDEDGEEEEETPEEKKKREKHEAKKKKALEELKAIVSSTGYSIIGDKLLGDGGYGVVSLVKKPREDEILVLKVPYFSDDRREYEIHSQICDKFHNNIIQVDGYINSGQNYAILMEYAERGTLNRRINPDEYTSTPIPSKLGRKYFRQIIAGIKHMHSLDIAHLDIKSDNIFLTADNVIKIGDFGEAQSGMKDTKVFSGVGSAQFGAPEMLPSGNLIDGFPCDVWSAGIVLIHMTIGYHPWKRPTMKDRNYRKWESNQLNGKWPQINDEMMCLLRKILVNDVSMRGTIESIEADPWFAKKKSAMTPQAHQGQLVPSVPIEADPLFLKKKSTTMSSQGPQAQFSSIVPLDEVALKRLRTERKQDQEDLNQLETPSKRVSSQGPQAKPASSVPLDEIALQRPRNEIKKVQEDSNQQELRPKRDRKPSEKAADNERRAQEKRKQNKRVYMYNQ